MYQVGLGMPFLEPLQINSMRVEFGKKAKRPPGGGLLEAGLRN
jgi:hypothetical protein